MIEIFSGKARELNQAYHCAWLKRLSSTNCHRSSQKKLIFAAAAIIASLLSPHARVLHFDVLDVDIEIFPITGSLVEI